MIFISQQLESKQKSSIHNNNIYTVEAPAFFFDREGTASLFRMEGIRLIQLVKTINEMTGYRE